jgi:hypothetical protein
MPTTGSERGSFVADGERDGPGGHIGLLRSPSPQRNDRVQSWLHAAMARGDKVATVAVPADLDTGGRADESSGTRTRSTLMNYQYSPRPSCVGRPGRPGWLSVPSPRVIED